jgi:hypothetical protein
MRRSVIVVLLKLILVGTTLPMFGEGNQPAQVTTTERVSFAAGGTIRIDHSYGDLNVEGWDRPEVEITVTKQSQNAAKHVEGVRIVTNRRSSTELTISTNRSGRRGVMIEYQIHAPRDSKLVIHHGTGSVFVSDVNGDIEATCGRGDILLMLRASGRYTFDAKSKLGTVSSDFDGTPRIRRYRLGERYVTANSESSRRIDLRMGFGGITIKAIPNEAYGAERVN